MCVLSISCFGGENMFIMFYWQACGCMFVFISSMAYRIYIRYPRTKFRRWSCWSKHVTGVRRLWEKWEFDSRLGKDSIQVRQWQSTGRRKGAKGFGRIPYLKRMCLRNQEGYTIFLLCCPAVSCCFNVQTRHGLQGICRSSDVQTACNL